MVVTSCNLQHRLENKRRRRIQGEAMQSLRISISSGSRSRVVVMHSFGNDGRIILPGQSNQRNVPGRLILPGQNNQGPPRMPPGQGNFPELHQGIADELEGRTSPIAAPRNFRPPTGELQLNCINNVYPPARWLALIHSFILFSTSVVLKCVSLPYRCHV
jgi:hypothetical protein